MTDLPGRLAFVKYEGAGNDFVCIDDREGLFAAHESTATIQAICDRHFGVGADGLILLRTAPPGGEAPLLMVYYNSDGAPSSFCGNGSRCFARFAADLGLEPQVGSNPDASRFHFLASDGEHYAHLVGADRVRVSMRVGAEVRRLNPRADVVDTGSPHYIDWCTDLPTGDIRDLAHEIRYSEAFAKTGINVNFVREEIGADGSSNLRLRTYERGVEDETLACGTGVTAAVLSFAERRNLTGAQAVRVEALGGSLSVSFTRETSGRVREVWLEGPVRRVFSGTFAS